MLVVDLKIKKNLFDTVTILFAGLNHLLIQSTLDIVRATGTPKLADCRTNG